MKSLRVGVVGLGRGRLFVDLFRKTPGCEVVAVCDTAERTLTPFADLATHTDFNRFLGEGLDVVAVISPGPVHAEQSIKAMQSGAHVLCETPCVYSVEEAKAVVSAVRSTGKTFMLAEDYAWSGWVCHVKESARRGELGEVVYAEGDYTHDCRNIMLIDKDGYVPYAERASHPDAVKSWRATHLPPILYTSHTLGPLLHIMDDRIVSAVGFSTGTHTAPDLGTIDLEAGLFETEKGAVVRLTNGFTVAHPFALTYNLVGTKGSARYSSTSTPALVRYSDSATPPMQGWEAPGDAWLERPDGGNPVAVMVGEFVQSIQQGTPPPLDVFRSLEFVLPGVLAHESAMQGGKKLEVPALTPDF